MRLLAKALSIQLSEIPSPLAPNLRLGNGAHNNQSSYSLRYLRRGGIRNTHNEISRSLRMFSGIFEIDAGGYLADVAKKDSVTSLLAQPGR